MANKKMKPAELLAALTHFTGTTQWYRNPLFPPLLYTDGVQFLAEHAGCYWLIDFIFKNQLLPEIKATEFQVWKLSIKDSQITIQVKDGNKNIVKQFESFYTDFPLSECTLWLIEKVLLLPSEY